MQHEIRVVQKSEETDPKASKRWFHWRVSLEGASEDMDRIISVTYFLHPSFPIKEVTRTNRSDGFAFSTGGWGTFTLRLGVKWRRDEGIEETIEHEHYLDFSGEDKITEFELKI